MSDANIAHARIRGRAGELEGGKLYELCVKKLPNHLKTYDDNGEKKPFLDIKKMAKDLNLRRQTIYVWFRNDVVQPNRVVSLMNLPGSLLKLEDLTPFAEFIPSELLNSDDNR